MDRLKRKAIQEDQNASIEAIGGSEDENDSMIDSASEEDVADTHEFEKRLRKRTATERATSPVQSTTSTNLDCTPEALAAKFPSLFSTDPAPTPKILITTNINGTVHKEADLLTELFPNSVYIPRSSHRYSHRFSVREICSFAASRKFTAVLVLKEDLKRLTGLTVVHLPSGPTFHFSISVGHLLVLAV